MNPRRRSSRLALALAALLWVGTLPVLRGMGGLAESDPSMARIPRLELGESMAQATFGAFRLVIFDFLMLRLTGQMEQGSFYEQLTLSETITRLMPRLEAGWLYHGWNLSCNVPEEMEDPESRWRYVREGILMYRRGQQKNPHSWSLPFWEASAYLYVCARSEAFSARLREDEELNPLGLSPERLAFHVAWPSLAHPDHTVMVDFLVLQALEERPVEQRGTDLDRLLDHLRGHGEDFAELIRRAEAAREP
jgi:hypothetical protein